MSKIHKNTHISRFLQKIEHTNSKIVPISLEFRIPFQLAIQIDRLKLIISKFLQNFQNLTREEWPTAEAMILNPEVIVSGDFAASDTLRKMQTLAKEHQKTYQDSLQQKEEAFVQNLLKQLGVGPTLQDAYSANLLLISTPQPNRTPLRISGKRPPHFPLRFPPTKKPKL